MSADGTTDQTATDARHRLADMVKRRRQELGLSVRGAADAGGLARGTWIALEDGTRKTADNNYAGIERVLRWAPGSVAAILAGESPATADDQPEATTVTAGAAAVGVSAASATASVNRDEAIIRVMRSEDLTEDQKRRIVQMLIAERVAFDRQIAERAEQLIDLMRGQG